MINFDKFETVGVTKMVFIRKNGDETGRNEFYIEPDWQYEDFLRAAGQRLGIHANYAFNEFGMKVDLDLVDDLDMVILSHDDFFIKASSSIIPSSHDDESIPSVVGPYIVSTFLGKGGFGEVRKGTHQFTGMQVALKFASKREIQNLADVNRSAKEFQVLGSLKHRNIINMISREDSPRYLVLAFELMEGGDLHEYLYARGPLAKDSALDNTNAKLVFEQILSGVFYAHSQGIIHRDLKLENIFLSTNSLHGIKIGDFGLSDFLEKRAPKQEKFDGAGTLYILPPEVLDRSNMEMGPQFDIWALGIVLFALLNGRLPFGGPDLNFHQQPSTSIMKQRILSGVYTIDKHIHPHAQELIKQMLHSHPKERITIDQIRSHPWLTEVSSDAGLPPLPVYDKSFLSQVSIQDSIDEVISVESGFTTKSNASSSKLHIDELEKDIISRAYPRKTYNVNHSNSNMPLITKMVRHPSSSSLDQRGRSSPSLRSSPDLFNDTRISPGIHERTITFDALTGISQTTPSNLHDLDDELLDRSEHGTIRMFSTGRIKGPKPLAKIMSEDEAEEEELLDNFDKKNRTIHRNSSGSSGTSTGTVKSDNDSWVSPSSSSSSSKSGWGNRRMAMGTSSMSGDGLSRSMRMAGGTNNVGSIQRAQSEKYEPDKFAKLVDNSTRRKSEKYEPDKFAKLVDSSARRHSTTIGPNDVIYTGTLAGGGGIGASGTSTSSGFKPLPRRPSSDQLSRSLHSVGLAIASGGKSEATLGLSSRLSGDKLNKFDHL